MQASRLVSVAVQIGVLFVAGSAPAKAGQWHPLGGTLGFPGLHRELQTLVDRRTGPAVARICVVLRDNGGGEPTLYALWPQAHRLYRWSATREAQLGDDTLVQHAPLDLQRDIARTAADRLSTYKVSRAWVADVTAQCRTHGEIWRLQRTSAR